MVEYQWTEGTGANGENEVRVKGRDVEKCVHDWEWLRQEERWVEQENRRPPGYVQFDVFYCRRCLEMRQVER